MADSTTSAQPDTSSSDTYDLGALTVHRIGFGAMQLPGRGVMGPPRDRDAAVAVLRRAVELGVDHIDTAQFYGPDVANELIREALHPYPEGLALVSKVGARRDAKGGWPPAQLPAELREDVHANLRSLGVEQLAAVNLRITDPVPHYTPPPLEDQLAEMLAMQDEGLIAGIGLSSVTLEQLDTALGQMDIVCVQNAYSILDRTHEELLQRCVAEEIAFVPFFPLGSAFPGMPKVADQPQVKAVAERHGATPAQVGLAWLLQHAPNVLLIPGTSSVTHLEENLGTAGVTLSAEDLAELDTIS
ncbi:oxidoreductase [uncultured Friedmanniella sp.]|uniref:oxidoreductase n=1 Tax=uncultured Friedmanniella sp. TaxID=335381 RepID=UPI0035C94DD8